MNKVEIPKPQEQTKNIAEKLRLEAVRHKSDYLYGSPLSLGGILIAFHAADCPRCGYLARKAALATA